ncbi:uncharacterized protein JCM6883_006023 [Sporobolomyces salmoneus]|uniref:uncharacterized protein n=1 Tax=Sporobolomyces salmoneus TaxID=183962 RepID=UPI003171B3F3
MSTHNGYVKEFPFIRIDSFTSSPNPSTSLHPLYHFLTHAHTDHLVGLNSPAFRGTIYMTPVTKMLVANTMEAAERVRWEEFGRDRIKRPVRKFENLFKVRAGANAKASTSAGTTGGTHGRGMDQIREINPNHSIKLRGPNDGDWVRVTAIDANHCPGSCMFLFEGVVEGTERSCLVTGDLRAESWYLTSLMHNPLLAAYTTRLSSSTSIKGKEKASERYGPVKALDCIYLDTSNVLLDEELVTKEQAIDDLIELVKQYPEDTKFFLNSWTWGYEDLLKGVYKAFGAESIHLDWYKHRIYTAPSIQNSDPLLATLGALSPYHEEPHSHLNLDKELDPSPSLYACPPPSIPSSSDKQPRKKSLRFHACERYWKCDQVWQDGRGCYTWTDEYLALRRKPSEERPHAKKLVKPGSGEYLRPDGAIGVADEDEEEEEERLGKVVYVNPVEMMKWKWEEYRTTTQEKITKARRYQARMKIGKNVAGEEAEFPNSLLVPLARHSTLPELQRFVSIFRPQTLYPLTISTADLRQPARDYLSMSSLFSSCLAEGGALRLKKEAKEFVKEWKERRGVVVTSSPEDDNDDVEDGMRLLGEGAWEREMRKRGLNVEGGKEVVEEVLKWSTIEERPIVENGGVRDMEEEPRDTGTGSGGGRRLDYGGSISQQSNDAPTTSSLELLPSAFPPPSVRTSTPSKRSLHPAASKSVGRTLRKSVTFASPTTTPKSPELSAGSSTSTTMKRTRSLPLPSPSPVNKNLRPVLQPAPAPVPSNSVASPADSENAAPHNRSPSSAHRKKRQKPIKTEEERKQERLILALQRTLQGKIGPDGNVIPFTEKERETLKRRERRLKEETRLEKGKGREVSVDSARSLLQGFGTVGSSY